MNILLFFILGSVMGSFLSVAIKRLPIDETIVWGRSHCFSCRTKILARDLIPLASFFILRGRCRNCQQKISYFYPLLEIMTGLIFVAVYYRFYDVLAGLNLYLFFTFYLLAIMALLIILFTDFFYFFVPDRITVPAIIISLILSSLNIFLSPKYGTDFFIYAPFWGNLLGGALIGAGFFFLLVFLSKERWMGWGDVKLGLFLGIILGWPLILINLLVAFIAGGFWGAFLIILKKKKKTDVLPFAPFLVMGFFIAFFWGKYIIQWYNGV
ncbi:prepilin peptidase [Candidatus Microgenomates bacterium]|nr:prepilin peptidase [Candidatus Microgenomates bacterium]